MVAQHAGNVWSCGRHTAVQLELDALRDIQVLRRYEAGETLASIGAGVGLTRERIRQIVKASGAAMPWDYKCAVKTCSTSPHPLRDSPGGIRGAPLHPDTVTGVSWRLRRRAEADGVLNKPRLVRVHCKPTVTSLLTPARLALL
jgi:Sigma-70, region 4